MNGCFYFVLVWCFCLMWLLCCLCCASWFPCLLTVVWVLGLRCCYLVICDCLLRFAGCLLVGCVIVLVISLIMDV